MKETVIIEAIDSFIRSQKDVFSVNDLKTHLLKLNLRPELIDLPSFIKAHPSILQTQENTYVSRSSVFIKKKFSIKPSKNEISMGILIPGHRTMPFTDPELYPHELKFVYEDVLLPTKSVKLTLSDALDHIFLYGEEFIPQLLTADPANEGKDFITNDFPIPNNVDISILDMEELYKKTNFSYGDRFIAEVIEWHEGIITLTVQQAKKRNPFDITEADEQRQNWLSNFDTAIKKTITTAGPLGSIEEQIAYTFYQNQSLLCTDFACSTEEYLTQTEDISIEYYGVESRLWTTGEEIPAVGVWSDISRDDSYLENTLYEEIGIPIPYYILDAYIFDSLFRKEHNHFKIFERIIPEKQELLKENFSHFLTLIHNRYEKLQKTYNRFTDFEKGPIRSQTLELYSQLITLICSLDASGSSMSSLPQQQLVILSQLFSHTTKFLDIFMSETAISKYDISMMKTSLDGMYESFEDIASELNFAMKNSKKGFTLI